MSEHMKGWSGIGGFRQLAHDLHRQAVIEIEADRWWLREFEFARWASDTCYPQAIARWVHEIGQREEWK